MKIAVTGHLGTLGAPLTKALRHQGHDVTGIDIRHSHDGFRADVGEYRQIERVLPDVEMVYHLAAEFGRHNGEDYTEQVWKTNVIGTKNMLRLQKERGFKMVFASSSEVYGERGSGTLREDLPPMYLPNDYAISKQVNEAQILNAGTETMILRFFNAYGPGEFYHSYRSVVCLFIYRALKGIPYTVYKNYYRVFQYIDDFIKTMANVPQTFTVDTINLGGRGYHSVEEMHEIVSHYVGVDPDRPEVVFLSEDEHNVVCKKPDISKAEEILGHDPTMDLDEGIRRTVEWMRDVYTEKGIPVLGRNSNVLASSRFDSVAVQA